MTTILCTHKAPAHSVILCSQNPTKMQPVLAESTEKQTPRDGIRHAGDFLGEGAGEGRRPAP